MLVLPTGRVTAEEKLLEDFSQILDILGDTVQATQNWKLRSFIRPQFSEDPLTKDSGAASLKVDGEFYEDTSGTRFEIMLRDEDRDLSDYERVTFMIRPDKNVKAGAVLLRITADGVRTGFIHPVDRMDLPGDSWSKVAFPIPVTVDVSNTELVEIYFGRGNHPGYTFHIDTLALERESREDIGSPIWIEFDNVARMPRLWWRSQAAAGLAERVVRSIRIGQQNIGLPLGESTVPDGILATQLMVLAHAYANFGEEKYKDAFKQGLTTLLDAQYPSGGWPTIYPRYEKHDLHGDMYAGETWGEIPKLLNEILARQAPFNADILGGIDLSLVEDALRRIPAMNTITRFVYSDYAAKAPSWWSSDEAKRIGDNLISWQMPHGGWWENISMATLPFSPATMRRSVSVSPTGIEQGTFDDFGTVDPLRFLAKLYEATEIERFQAAFYRGADFIMAAQYASGGWPQRFPDPSGYSRHVTFNDQVMTSVLTFLQDIALEKGPFGFVQESYRRKSAQAFDRGIDYILAAQIEVDGRLTAWGQQHDAITYEPQAGRIFEPVAITANESVGIAKLLQTLPDPSNEIKRAILSALEWFEEARLSDGRWARFYEIGTNRPLFVGRDGVIRYDVTEIDAERQSGYAWFGTWPEKQVADLKLIDALYEALPDHPTVRVRFSSPEPGQTVSGLLPVDLSFIHATKERSLRQVRIILDGYLIYAGATMPASGDLLVDTRQLADGRHTLTIETEHKGMGIFAQSVTFHVSNTWRVVVDMKPPFESAWFGTVEYLHTAERSDGWGYDTGRADDFFGDRDRLVRVSEESEYLVWETPHIKDVELILYTSPGTPVREGLELAVSPDGEVWEPLAYDVRVMAKTGDREQIAIDVGIDNDSPWNKFRLTLSRDIPQESLWLGRIVLSGYLP